MSTLRKSTRQRNQPDDHLPKTLLAVASHVLAEWADTKSNAPIRSLTIPRVLALEIDRRTDFFASEDLQPKLHPKKKKAMVTEEQQKDDWQPEFFTLEQNPTPKQLCGVLLNILADEHRKQRGFEVEDQPPFDEDEDRSPPLHINDIISEDGQSTSPISPTTPFQLLERGDDLEDEAVYRNPSLSSRSHDSAQSSSSPSRSESPIRSSTAPRRRFSILAPLNPNPTAADAFEVDSTAAAQQPSSDSSRPRANAVASLSSLSDASGDAHDNATAFNTFFGETVPVPLALDVLSTKSVSSSNLSILASNDDECLASTWSESETDVVDAANTLVEHMEPDQSTDMRTALSLSPMSLLPQQPSAPRDPTVPLPILCPTPPLPNPSAHLAIPSSGSTQISNPIIPELAADNPTTSTALKRGSPQDSAKVPRKRRTPVTAAPKPDSQLFSRDTFYIFNSAVDNFKKLDRKSLHILLQNLGLVGATARNIIPSLGISSQHSGATSFNVGFKVTCSEFQHYVESLVNSVTYAEASEQTNLKHFGVMKSKYIYLAQFSDQTESAIATLLHFVFRSFPVKAGGRTLFTPKGIQLINAAGQPPVILGLQDLCKMEDLKPLLRSSFQKLSKPGQLRILTVSHKFVPPVTRDFWQ